MDSSTFDTEEDDSTNIEAWCLNRVGKNSDWLRLFENTEVTIGRAQDVTYQLLSSSYPLMISRLHCIFKQRESGEWTVTDRRSLNGVWVNGKRIPEEVAHRIKLGDSIRLGVPVVGTEVEYEYIFEKRPLKDIKPHLATVCREDATAFKPKKNKRKYNSEELEPSTSSKAKLYRCSSSDRTLAQPCSITVKPSLFVTKQPEDPGPSTRAEILCQSLHGSSSPYDDLDDLHRYSQNIQRLREQVSDTQKQVASLDDSQREAQVRGLQKQLATLQAKMYRMETLKKSFSETKKQLEAQKTKYQEELLKKQLDEALQEQKKVMGELALSRRGFAEILLAKNKELEETKEEKEKARAQKEEVVTQVTEVLENELQCIICSELFIEAVILNCAHSFCMYCIREWRKRKDECPICRQAIQSQTRCLALDNCINSMVDNLSLDVKARRQTLITERKAKTVEVMVIKDDESSSSSSSDDLDNVRDSDSDSDILSGSERSLLSLSSVSSVVSVNTDSSIQLNYLDYLDTSELED